MERPKVMVEGSNFAISVHAVADELAIAEAGSSARVGLRASIGAAGPACAGGAWGIAHLGFAGGCDFRNAMATLLGAEGISPGDHALSIRVA
jgi:hypothetical protein